MKKNRLVVAGIILFIGINSLLLYFDDNRTVERKSYISEWSEVFTANLYEKMHKTGVLSATVQNDVYFDESLGSFKEFLVDKGTEVSQGDDLYTYRITDFYESKAYLTNELAKINEEIAAAESAQSEMSAYRIPRTSVQFESETGNATGNDDEAEQNITIVPPRPPIETEYMKEEYLAEKEKEIEQLEAQQKSIQTQLTELESGGDTITVESPYQGKVAMVSEDLGDPIVSIQSTTLHIEGELTEIERPIIEAEMPVEISINENNVKLKGSVTQVSDLPNDVNLHDNSEYPFQVSFSKEEELEKLLPGYHAKLAIITEASEEATALFEDAIFSESVWKMTNKGDLLRQKVETGIEMNSMQEITKGAKIGEWTAKKPRSQFRSGPTFVTPLKLGEVRWREAFGFDDRYWTKNVVTGIVSR
ncbi:HlyD family efflux transporter periplasmic adaptor subunit [Virgibacillus flavescens]|uniref:HlyD family efflux transporter periplasmic adaptor subunit n=1 Tax=Virgibacillus flavescens TaxID=1611422 RepID=UPI003D332438